MAGRGRRAPGVPPADIPELRNLDGQVRTIRVDSKVIQETDTEGAKSDEVAWMRFTPRHGRQARTGRATRRGGRVYPDGFEELATTTGTAAPPAGPGRPVHRLAWAC